MSVNYCNKPNDTLLHLVSRRGDCHAIRTLILGGAQINAKGKTGDTPLHYAIKANRPKAVTLLIELGAKNIEDIQGDTPLQLALNMDNQALINALGIGI